MRMRLFINRSLVKRFDIIACFCGVVCLIAGGVVLILEGYPPIYVMAVGLGLAGCIIYLFSPRGAERINKGGQKVWWLDLLFLAGLIACILIYVLRGEVYTRPLAFFIVLSICAGVLAVKIILAPERHDNKMTLLQIAAIGLTAIWSVTLLYPSIVGLDPWWHQQRTFELLEEGYVNFNSLSPMYLIIAGVMKITGWSYRIAAMVIPLIEVVGNTLLIYYIGKIIWSRRVGLLAALAASFATWTVFFGYWTIPNSLALTIVLGVVLLLLVRQKKLITFRVFMPSLLVLFLVLVFTHPIATVWAVMAMGLFWLVQGRWSWKEKSKQAVPVIVVVLMVFGLWQWIGYVGSLRNLIEYEFNAEELGFTTALGLEGDDFPVGTGDEPSGNGDVPDEPSGNGDVPDEPSGNGDVPDEPIENGILPDVTDIESPVTEMLSTRHMEFAFNSSGMLVYCAVAVVGVFRMVAYTRRRLAFAIAIFGVITLAMGFIPMLMGMSVLEHRWWLLAQVLLSIPLGIGVLMITGGLGRYKRAIVFGVVVAVLCFLNIIGLPSNMDNRTFSENQLARYAFTQGELDAINYMSIEYDGSIGVDGYYTATKNVLNLVRDSSRLVNISPNLIDGTLAELDCNVILIRDEVVNGLLAVGSGTVHKLNYDPIQRLIDAGYCVVYQNNDVTGLVKCLDS